MVFDWENLKLGWSIANCKYIKFTALLTGSFNSLSYTLCFSSTSTGVSNMQNLQIHLKNSLDMIIHSI